MQPRPQKTKGRGSSRSAIWELDVQILVNVPHVSLPVLLSFELTVGTEGAGGKLVNSIVLVVTSITRGTPSTSHHLRPGRAEHWQTDKQM